MLLLDATPFGESLGAIDVAAAAAAPDGVHPFAAEEPAGVGGAASPTPVADVVASGRLSASPRL